MFVSISLLCSDGSKLCPAFACCPATASRRCGPHIASYMQMAMAHTANQDSRPGAAQYSGHHHPAVSFNSNHNLSAHHMAPAASNAAGGYGKRGRGQLQGLL